MPCMRSMHKVLSNTALWRSSWMWAIGRVCCWDNWFYHGNSRFSLRIWRELGSQKKPNRIPVLRDQKVLPEVRNRSLLVRDLVSYSNSEILLQSNRWTYSFIPSISDIPISLSCSLRSSSNRRLVISELHFDTRFKIYSSTIGVRNLVCYVPLGQ